MTSAIFAAAIGALFISSSGQSPAEPPAVLRRPNLQVLTKVPESQLFPMMNAIADSLGVRCDYCHVRVAPDPSKTWSLAGGWVWDRDDLSPKRTARDMMRMVLDINEKQFGGRMMVTCYTCHRGASAPGRFPPLPPRDMSIPSAPEPKALPSVDDVWAAYTRAVVGSGPARIFSTTVMLATDERSEGRHGTIEIAFKDTDRVRLTFRMPPDAPASQALNGDAGWLATGDVARPLRPDEVTRVRRAALRFRPIKIERPANLRISGIERIGGRDAYVAVGDVDARTRKTLLFDIASGLLVRERTTTETTLVPLQEEIDYEDYRSVDGVMLPFVARSSDGSPFDTSVRTFTSIRHDVEVADDVFEQPARVPAPQAPLPQAAGARFKSVRVLTDMPASLMIPTMAFISNSLGVTCLHCHTDVYESDEKPMKEKARGMIRMMRAVNDAQFGGKRAVTCQTCHNGHAVPESTPAVENAGWNSPPRLAEAPLPAVADVVMRYEQAAGIDALARLQSQRLTGTVTRNSGRTDPASSAFELYQEKPRTLRLSTDLSHPPEADVELPMTFLRPALLQVRYPDLHVVGRERIGEVAVVVAAGTSERGAHRLYFSEASGLLVRRSDEIDTPLGAVPERYDFDDFARVDGVAVPKRIVWSRADYQVTFAVASIGHEASR